MVQHTSDIDFTQSYPREAREKKGDQVGALKKIAIAAIREVPGL